MEVCTIIAKNYVAYARVLARSLLEHDPEARIWALIIDDIEGYIDAAQEPFEILTPSQVGCEPFTEMSARYSVLELSTAVKPWLLRHLLASTGGPVTYLDPDIQVHGSLRALDEVAAAHRVVLIPHNLEPIPFDERKPSQVDIMIAGIYNLGYVSLGPGGEVDRLLDWWGERLLRDCRVDPVWGYFVDQRWFDLAPGFLDDFAVVREPEYNVAYWNLHSRRLEHDGDRYLVEGRPLAFFHFSGFDPRHRLVLSRHQNRIDVSSHPVLERLLGEYAAALAAAGHERSRHWPYTFDRLGDGTPVDDALRMLLDEHARTSAAPPSSPFTPQGARAFSEWMTGQPRTATIRRPRPSPLPPGGMRAAVPAFGADGNVVPGLDDQAWGVNVVGYFRSELGVGAAARHVVSALDASEVPALPIHGQTIPLSRQGHTYETASPQDAVFPVNLICVNADMLPEFASQAGERFFAGRYSIGLWFWEVNAFPDRWRNAFAQLEEVWAPTAHIADALAPVSTVPIHTTRIPVQLPELEARSRADLKLPPQDFLFLFAFDYLSIFVRKNPLAVVEAFHRTMAGRSQKTRLVLKCINQEHAPEAHAQLLEAIGQDPAIILIDRYLSPEDNVQLSALCDCYVSLHRAEGFGLGMAEAMWHGTPVIATGYSGNLDFMNSENSLLVDYELVPVGLGAEPYPPEATWANPDVEHAARLMGAVLDDPHAARERGRRAAQDIRRTHSPAAVGKIMYRRLEAIRGTWSPRPGGALAARRGAGGPLGELLEKVHHGLNAQGRPSGRARRQLRGAVLRAMRPFTTYQQSINLELVSALRSLSGDLAAHRREMSTQLASLRAELRQERARQESGR